MPTRKIYFCKDANMSGNGVLLGNPTALQWIICWCTPCLTTEWGIDLCHSIILGISVIHQQTYITMMNAAVLTPTFSSHHVVSTVPMLSHKSHRTVYILQEKYYINYVCKQPGGQQHVSLLLVGLSFPCESVSWYIIYVCVMYTIYLSSPHHPPSICCMFALPVST